MAIKADLYKTLEHVRAAKGILDGVVNRTHGMLSAEFNDVVLALRDASLKPGPKLKAYLAELNDISDWWLGPLGVPLVKSDPPLWAVGLLDQVSAAEVAAAEDWADESS